MRPAASVIIPNWNGAHLLRTCLDALRCQTRQDFETIVVDNGSTDDSRRLLADDYPEVLVIPLRRNVFFSGAVNIGIERAAGDVLVLLNNDTEAEAGWLDALLAALDDHPEAGMATSKLLLFDQRTVLHSAGDTYSAAGLPGNRGVWQVDTGQYDADTTVFGACAGAAAYRRSMLTEIGLFDEQFIGYCEDVDLSFRAQLAGYQCVFAPAARVYHMVSATGGGPRASYLCGKNFLNVIVKNMPAPLLRRNALRLLRAQLAISAEAIRHLREPSARARLRGQVAAIADLPGMISKRRTIQAGRRVPIATLAALLDG